MKLTEAFFADKSRWISGLALSLATILAIFSGFWFVFWLFFGAAYIISTFEAARFLQIEKDPYLYTISAAIWMVAPFLEEPILLFLLALLLVSIPSMYNYKNFHKIASLLIYPTLPFLMLISIYNGVETPQWYLLLLFLSVAFCDMGAYFGGRSYGRRKLAPSISPNKTVEGAISGLILGTLVGSIVGVFLFSNIYIAILTAFAVTFFSIVGDLFESYLKRMFDKKDSGSIFPGHGGVLDRMDGVLFGAVVLYILIRVIN